MTELEKARLFRDAFALLDRAEELLKKIHKACEDQGLEKQKKAA